VIVVIPPPVEHHAVEHTGFDRRARLRRHVLAVLGVGVIQLEEAAFLPALFERPIGGALPPLVVRRKERAAGIAVADLRQQHHARISREQFGAHAARIGDALRLEAFGQARVRGVPSQPEELRGAEQQVVAGGGGEAVFAGQVVRRAPRLKDGGKGAGGDAHGRGGRLRRRERGTGHRHREQSHAFGIATRRPL
jgi:hypothetical protein